MKLRYVVRHGSKVVKNLSCDQLNVQLDPSGNQVSDIKTRIAAHKLQIEAYGKNHGDDHRSVVIRAASGKTLKPVTIQMEKTEADHSFFYEETESFLHAILNGSDCLSYSCDLLHAQNALKELVREYCGIQGEFLYCPLENETGKYLVIEKETFQDLQTALWDIQFSKSYDDLKLQNAIGSMHLEGSQHQMICQINGYIRRHYFGQEAGASGIPAYVHSLTGKCWFFAKLFANLCSAANIQSWIMMDQDRIWVQVLADGQYYGFYPSINSASQNLQQEGLLA